MSREEIKSAVRDYLVEELYFDPDSDTDDTDLIESGSIDSLGFINLMNFLQTTFDVRFAQTDMRPESFRSIGVIADSVTAKLEKSVST